LHTVRHFEQFTVLHLGLLAQTRRKSLPRLGKTVHMDPQALHHFLAHAEWSVQAVRQRRLELLRQAVGQAVGQTPFILCLDETGARKKGHSTDYVASQYIGKLHTLANGIVSVNASGVLGATTVPLLCRIFKPQTRLKASDVSKTKPQLAIALIALIEELLAVGFRFRVVLADSLYGESGPFIEALHHHRLQYVVALRSNHGVWMLPGQRLRRTRWRSFDRVFTDGRHEQRFLRETIFGTRRSVRYFQITTDPKTLPPETTWDRMTNQPGQIEDTMGNTFGLRTWIEYGFKHAKDDRGWADYRVTDDAAIERWWELVMSAYTLVSRQTVDIAPLGHLAPASSSAPHTPPPDVPAPLDAHPAWDTRSGWKHHLNTLRLLLQPYVCSCLLLPWLALARLGSPWLALARLGSPWCHSRTRMPSRLASPRSAPWSMPSA
jgi:SRSO17 transposase